MKKIIHIDADCFFASVELLRQPTLKNVPFAVGGSPAGRGVICSCNYIARSFGVRSAMSSAVAKRICPDLRFITPDMRSYKDASIALFAILQEYSDRVEAVSVDEAFLDVSDSHFYQNSATLIARDIQKRVKAELGLPVSAGIAPVKFLAKIASDWNKPFGIFTIAPEEVEPFTRRLSLRLLPGVGPRTWRKLQALGLLTGADIRSCDISYLVSHFGSFASRLYELSCGKDEREVISQRERKSISVEQTFDIDIPKLNHVLSRIPILLPRLQARWQASAKDLRVGGRALKLKFDDFSQTTVELRVHSAANAFDETAFQYLASVAWSRAKRPVRLLGLGLRLAPTKAETLATQLELDLC